MNVRLFLAWYDFWIGLFYDQKKTTLYICLVPCVVLSVEFVFCYQIIGHYTGRVIGYCWGYDGKQGVLEEEPMATFRRISRRQYDFEHRP